MKTGLKRSSAGIAASLLSLVASGEAVAQIVVDGKLDKDYRVLRWVQTQSTSAGDNSQASMPSIGNPQSVTKGIEIKVPVSALGNPGTATPIRMGGLIVSPDYTQASNQVVGSLLCDALALGSPRLIRFDQLENPTDNKQFVTIQSGKNVTPPVIDGTLDGAYGSPLFLQAASAAGGDSTDGQADYSGASEIDAVYVIRTITDVYVFIAGNIATDGSHLMLFFDSRPGMGQNVVRGDNGYYALNILGDDGTGNGLRFDSELVADYCLDFSGFDPDGPGALPATFSVTYAEVLTLGGGRAYYCGSNVGGGVVGGALSGGQGNAPALKATVDNTNSIGVNIQRCDSVPDVNRSIGSELDNLAMVVDGDFLYVLIAGNLKTDGSVLNLFLDDRGGQGQNVLRGDNPRGTNDMLAKMAGLRFDPEFTANYWIGVRTIKNGPDYELWADAVVLRSGGARTNVGGFPLDYTAYAGGIKNLNDPIWFDGPRIDVQPGTAPEIFTQYAPSLAGDTCLADPLHPWGTAGLLAVALDNSNVKGVGAYPNGGIGSAALVSTGVELKISLAELGWNGNGAFRIAGFIADPTNTTMSNQVLGSLPAPLGSLGPISLVDFSTMAGAQFIFSGCLADFDSNGYVNGNDYDAFAEAFEVGNWAADVNNDGYVNGNDYDVFAEAFEAGC